MSVSASNDKTGKALVELSSTCFITFNLLERVGSTNTYSLIDPDEHESEHVFDAVLEDTGRVPKTIEVLPFQRKSAGIFMVAFYADPAKYEVGQAFYITIYWEKGGFKLCERAPVGIQKDVRASGVEEVTLA